MAPWVNRVISAADWSDRVLTARRGSRGRDTGPTTTGDRTGDRTRGEPGRPYAAPLVAVALLVVVVVVVVVLPWSDHPVVRVPGLLPAWLATSMSCFTVTAVLLLGRSRGGASPRLVVLSAGYLWSTAMTAGVTLALPGIVTDRPVIPDADAMWWFWISSHLVLPVCIALALVPWPARWRFGVAERSLEDGGPDLGPGEDVERAVHSRLLSRVVAPVLVVAVVLVLLGEARPSLFPTVSEAAPDGGTRLVDGVLVVVACVNVLAVVAAVAGVLVRRSRSGLESWAVVAAVAFLADVLLAGLHPPAYSVGFYAARVLGLVTATVVLAVLLHDLFTLHRRTAEDAGRLAEQNRELRDAARLSDHLIAVVSHEMRTPLAGLQGYLELMSENLASDTDRSGDTARMLERSWLLTRRLTLLTEDLVTVATAEHGEFAVIPETVNLTHQLDECVACFPGLDLRIDCPPDLLVRADTLRLQQVLSHLVRNAQKHGAEPIFVTASLSSGVDVDHVTIRVADSGAGVPRDFVHLLFERYSRGRIHQARGAGKTGTGSGLGLSVVRDLVRAHGGTVRYDLTHPAFVITLPQPAAQPAAQPWPAPAYVASDIEPTELGLVHTDLPVPDVSRDVLADPLVGVLDLPVDVPDTLTPDLSDQVSDAVASIDQRPQHPVQGSALAALTAVRAETPPEG